LSTAQLQVLKKKKRDNRAQLVALSKTPRGASLIKKQMDEAKKMHSETTKILELICMELTKKERAKKKRKERRAQSFWFKNRKLLWWRK
jgi:hypothetical protein